ncbi:MAG TPA: molybdate ABC transporter substrate-binding protein [Kineosporiaceae bacterium]|nr:molybdate ABC transporter substrate-binding protein [Kineosporiaceae bacterium]
MRRPVLPVLVAVCAAAVLLGGCGPSSSGAPAGNPAASTGSSAASGGITVFAAASLTGSFTTLGQRFQATHPGTKVTFSFGASSTLATQIVQGAPADVFASASGTNLQQVVSGGAATSSVPFARNVMEIAVPPGNPARISSVADLARPGVKVAVCASAVPCGAVARQVFGKAGVSVTPVTEEADVKATLTKVELGEVDAGVVYVTDVRAAGTKVTGVAIPDAVNAATAYPIAVLQGSHNPALAKAFVDYVLSADGAAVLTAAGFTRP